MEEIDGLFSKSKHVIIFDLNLSAFRTVKFYNNNNNNDVSWNGAKNGALSSDT